MIYKVLYQNNLEEAPVRERTKSVYLEAGSVREARKKINERGYNIEYIQALDEAHLNYEEQSEEFAVENV